MARGAGWTVFIRLVSRLIGIVSTLILARLLSPTDFGFYSLAMSVYAFIELFRAFGFGTALVQRQDATDDHYNTAWSLHLCFSLFAASALFFAAPAAAGLLGDERLITPIQFLSVLFLIDGVKNIGTIDFQKHLTFDLEFRLAISVKLIGFCVTIPLAFALRSYWALLYGLLATALAHSALSYMMHPYRPKFSLVKCRDLLSFSAWLQVNNIVNFLNKHVEKFLVTRALGIGAVGSLAIARESGLFLRELLQPVNRAAFPGYSKVNDQPALVARLYIEVLGLLMLIAFPVGVGLSSVADLFVPVVLGDKWLQIIPLVQWFSLASIAMVAMGASNSVLVAMGFPRAATVIISVRLVVFVVCLREWLPSYGLNAVAYAYGCSLVVALCVSLFSVARMLGIALFAPMSAILLRPVVASLLMYGGVSFLRSFTPALEGPTGLAVMLCLSVGVGALVYSTAVLCLWLCMGKRGVPELRVLQMIHSKTGRLKSWLPETSAHG